MDASASGAEALEFVAELLPGYPAIVVSVWRARQGAQHAAEVGLEAEALARETNARLIACGNAKSGVKASVPTILPNALVQRARKPVLVVPSAKAATERRRELEKG